MQSLYNATVSTNAVEFKKKQPTCETSVRSDARFCDKQTGHKQAARLQQNILSLILWKEPNIPQCQLALVSLASMYTDMAYQLAQKVGELIYHATMLSLFHLTLLTGICFSRPCRADLDGKMSISTGTSLKTNTWAGLFFSQKSSDQII